MPTTRIKYEVKLGLGIDARNLKWTIGFIWERPRRKQMNAVIEKSAMRKVYLRLLPLTMLMYFLCYIDRINVSFAALTMNRDIGLTAAAYGFSSTAFYVGYVLFEVPSNLVMDKVGARLWLARIMVSWGLVSAATAAVVGPTSFLVVRFLLGAGEAGLFPGTILLFTYWFPDAHRGRIIGSFTLALPISVALGAPISTAILGMDGVLGVKGWQWIYLLEAIPTLIVGIFVLVAMSDRPETAKWLSAPEREWLAGTLQNERHAVEAGGKLSIMGSMTDPKILLLSLNYLGIVTASLGLLLFIPQIIRSLGASTMNTGYATSLAYICGAIAMILFGWLSDRLGDRRWLLFTTCMMATVGLVTAGATMGTWWSLAGMCLATAGFYGSKGPFWAMPTMILTGAAAASGIAFINAFGNVGGAVGPALVGWLKDTTGSYAGGLYGLAAFTGVGALIAAVGLRIPRRVGVGAVAPAE
jgi:MFS transporter, ACS family, tartrate transporter